VALKASGFEALYGRKPDFEIASSDPQVPDMIKYTDWATGNFALNNNGDEVLILNGSDAVVDAVVFEGGAYPGVVAHPGVLEGHSIERSPASQDTSDCSKDFVDRHPPTPGS
jgi:hypothetical protein